MREIVWKIYRTYLKILDADEEDLKRKTEQEHIFVRMYDRKEGTYK